MVLIKYFIKKMLVFLGFLKSKKTWPTLSDSKKHFLIKNVHIKSSVETINEIKSTILNKQKGAYMRFGDGDIFLMLGLDDMLHNGNKKMAKEMQEAMNLNIGILHKGLPIHSELFGCEKGMEQGVHLVSDKDALRYLSVTYKLLDFKSLVTSFALHQLARFHENECISFLRFLKSTNPIFVGNGNIKSEISKKLFGNIHIKTPLRDSYNEIDRIEKELIQILDKNRNEFRIVVVAMGCPGRILQKRILKKGCQVYLFDFGSLLDAFNGEDTRDWIALTGGVNVYTMLLNKL